MAGDQFIHPPFVFPRARLDNEIKTDAPAISLTLSRMAGSPAKVSWNDWTSSFRKVNPTVTNPVQLIVDSHTGHKNLDMILFAWLHHMHMLSFHPCTNHKFQPLDCTVTKPCKNAFNKTCAQWMCKYSYLKTGVKDIAGLVNNVLTNICWMKLPKLAFACTHIYLLNHGIFSDLDFLPSVELDFWHSQHSGTALPDAKGTWTPIFDPELSPAIARSDSLQAPTNPPTAATSQSPPAYYKKRSIKIMLNKISPVPMELNVGQE
jgi:hypothetical protein